jgi:hypothetical protein
VDSALRIVGLQALRLLSRAAFTSSVQTPNIADAPWIGDGIPPLTTARTEATATHNVVDSAGAAESTCIRYGSTRCDTGKLARVPQDMPASM